VISSSEKRRDGVKTNLKQAKERFIIELSYKAISVISVLDLIVIVDNLQVPEEKNKSLFFTFQSLQKLNSLFIFSFLKPCFFVFKAYKKKHCFFAF